MRSESCLPRRRLKRRKKLTDEKMEQEQEEPEQKAEEQKWEEQKGQEVQEQTSPGEEGQEQKEQKQKEQRHVLSEEDHVFFEACAKVLKWKSGCKVASKPDTITDKLRGKAIAFVFDNDADGASDASDDTDGDEDEDEGDEDEGGNRCIISVGRIKKVYEEGCLRHSQGLHAEVKFDDDDGPRDIPLTLELWDPLLNQAKKWVLLKPGWN